MTGVTNKDRIFSGGDFKMTGGLQKEAFDLADALMKYAKDHNIKIEDIPEVQSAKGFDKDAAHLSRDELAALVVGISIQKNVENRAPNALEFAGVEGIHAETTKDGERFNLKGVKEIASLLAQQLYGDTNPKTSSVDTSTQESLKPLDSDMRSNGAPVGRC